MWFALKHFSCWGFQQRNFSKMWRVVSTFVAHFYDWDALRRQNMTITLTHALAWSPERWSQAMRLMFWCHKMLYSDGGQCHSYLWSSMFVASSCAYRIGCDSTKRLKGNGSFICIKRRQLIGRFWLLCSVKDEEKPAEDRNRTFNGLECAVRSANHLPSSSFDWVLSALRQKIAWTDIVSRWCLSAPTDKRRQAVNL